MNIDDARREIQASRLALRQDFAALRAELDFAAKAKRVIARRPLPWLSGAAIFGFLLSGRRKQKTTIRQKNGKSVVKESGKGFTLLGILFGAARLIFPLVRPQLTAFATRKLTGLAGEKPPR